MRWTQLPKVKVMLFILKLICCVDTKQFSDLQPITLGKLRDLHKVTATPRTSMPIFATVLGITILALHLCSTFRHWPLRRRSLSASKLSLRNCFAIQSCPWSGTAYVPTSTFWNWSFTFKGPISTKTRSLTEVRSRSAVDDGK